MNKFEKWDREFRSQNMYAFNENYEALLWLKVRAICRGKQLKAFLKENSITLKSTKVAEQNVELFSLLLCHKEAMSILDAFLSCLNHEWYTELGVDVDRLKEDLYKVEYYSWGGDQNNSLDKYLISHYVKVISDYDKLQDKRANIGQNAWNYVQNSWYNNWTSFIIESLFKRNPKVISAVGEIKSVDFFIDNYPIDLKVTFFPNQYMEKKVREALGKSSLTWMKQKCKELGITCDHNAAENRQIYTLTEKLSEIKRCDIIRELDEVRGHIIREAHDNPLELIKWLYENQGEMRFGAENRLFLILADTTDLTQSWKLKRAFSIIEPKIQEYIATFSSKSLKRIVFDYKKREYDALADTLFIVK